MKISLKYICIGILCFFGATWVLSVADIAPMNPGGAIGRMVAMILLAVREAFIKGQEGALQDKEDGGGQ
jgi:hypothetical protein